MTIRCTYGAWLKCPICSKKVGILYRDRPKGQKAKSICLNCVPDNMKPDKETIKHAEEFHNALNPNLIK